MKKSHRKDVIIARIIFGAICLTALALISALVVFLHGLIAGDAPATETQTESELATWSEWQPDTESESQEESEEELESQMTEESEETEDDTSYVWARKTCKIRSLPNTESEVLGVLEEGQKIETTGEESGWIKVVINGQTGYIRSDLVTYIAPEGGM